MKNLFLAIAVFLPALLCYDGAQSVSPRLLYIGRWHESNRGEKRNNRRPLVFKVKELALEYI